MSVEIVYYNTPANEWLEQRLAVFGAVHTASGADRRGFLTALSQAVSVCDTTVAVGQIAALATVLSRGLGLPLTPVDWGKLGFSGAADVALPQGALPLIVEGSVYGMIIESAAQCIIAVDDDETAVRLLADNYVAPYIQALNAPEKEVEPDEQPQGEEAPMVDDIPDEVPAQETDVVEDDVVAEDEFKVPDEEPDLFADIDSDGFLDIEPKKKKHGLLIAFICVLLVLAIGAAGGYFGYVKWWLPKQSDDALTAARNAYSQAAPQDGTTAGMPADYSLKFASLYSINSDVIGWLKVSGLGINTPVVTAAMHSDGYYEDHLFNGKTNPYGTPYIKYGYDTAVNVNPNLVIYGQNTGDGRAFSGIEDLLTVEGLNKIKTVTTDSVLYGTEQWQIFSVMILDADGKEYDYTDNYREMGLENRIAALKGAVERSKIDTGYDPSDFDGISLTDTFLTLVTDYSEQEGKVVVVMACHTDMHLADDIVVEDIIIDDVSSQEPSDVSSDADANTSLDETSST